MRQRIFIASFLLFSTSLAGITHASGEKHALKPRINLPQARAIALQAAPGKIAKEELEKEKGGSGLRYSFDIVAKGITREVGVDAKDGKILENSVDNDKD